MNQGLDTLRDKWRHLVVHCRKKKYDVYIGRASAGAPPGDSCKWGNPFPMCNQSDQEREQVSCLYRDWIYGNQELITQARNELRGKVLACWCDPKYCHGHILAEIANSSADDMIMEPIETSIVSEVISSAPCGNDTIAKPFRAISSKKKTLPKSQIAQYLGTDPSNVFSTHHKSANDENKKHTDDTEHNSHDGHSVDNILADDMPHQLIDIGVNFTNKDCKKDWNGMLGRAHQAGVSTVILTGTCMSSTEESMRCVSRQPTSNISLYFTAGIHPHRAKSCNTSAIIRMREILLHDSKAVAVGECGLDFNRNLSSPDEQIYAFREQVRLACELNMPMFVHEREAHKELLRVLDEFGGTCRDITAHNGLANSGYLPPLVIHCFTGEKDEAKEYISRGFHIGLTGTICKHQRGAKLRDMLSAGDIPLDRIMLETDAPYMGFLKTRRNSEPGDVALVAEMIAKVLGVSKEEVSRTTSETTKAFFRLHRECR